MKVFGGFYLGFPYFGDTVLKITPLDAFWGMRVLVISKEILVHGISIFTHNQNGTARLILK